MSKPVISCVLPFSFGLVLLRDSAAAPVLKEDWTDESHELGVAASTSSAALTVADCHFVHVRVYRGLHGCVESANETTRVFRLRSPSRRLVIHELMDDRPAADLVTVRLDDAFEDGFRIVKTLSRPSEEELVMDLHLLTPSEYENVAGNLPPLMEQNYPDRPFIVPATRLPIGQRMSPFQKTLHRVLKRLGL
ncbi:hypothetical protein DES53_102163 [Roseimicrobium gellanilyticum]|uniref:Uncharacterized protein n=1 Tax=Roseimicrobium gellanilyticum TaxID=748857 RepID=A0A366HQ61_9BACT|nr:hypothetical protein [Roseimicrobium gellanilyticum]RBP45781.1 hypothetical protein DES53_102163 [Roseimicrobium gellanilyticum]